LAGENFGGFGGSLPIHQSFIHQKVVRSQLNSERILSTAKVFSRQSFVLYGSFLLS